jgi:hypothetical protein
VGRREASRRGQPHLFVVGMLTALAAGGYSAYCMARYHTFHYNAYDLLRRHGYQITFDRKGYIVLHRSSPERGAAASREAAG